MLRRLLAIPLLGLALAVAQPVSAAADSSGMGNLSLVGQGTRTMLFIDLYRVSLYMPGGRALASAPSPSGAIAFRIDILYGGDLPDRIPDDWAGKLLPPLDEPGRDTLRRTYATLGEGDALLVLHLPGEGTTMSLNGRAFLHDEGSGLMQGVVDLFMGPKPVSRSVRASLLSISEREPERGLF